MTAPTTPDARFMSVQHRLHDLERVMTTDSQPFDAQRVLIHATHDAEALHSYLTVRCAKATTRKTVLGALRKLLVFMSIQAIPTLGAFKVEDCQAFQQWLTDPDPDLCSGDTPTPVWLKHNDCPNPDWKPFRKPLSLVAANQAMAKVQALFQYLVDVDYLAGNPWKPVKALTQDRVKGQDHQDQAVHERELPIEVIHAIEGYFDRGQGFHGIDAEQFARWHWWWTFFLYTGARASSACTAAVDDIYLDRRGHHQLTLTVKGAGVRRKNVPWIPALERVYQHYRQTVGLPPIALNTRLTRREVTDPLPMGAGPRHLLLPVQLPRGDSTPLSYAAVHKQMSRLFKTVRLWVIASEQIQLADWHLQILEDATPHWIRHGTATLLGSEFATRQLGHSSAGQTATYIAEQSEVHRHKLATLTVSADPSESPRAQAVLTLLNLSIPERVAALQELMRSVEKEAPAELDTLWAKLASDI